MDKFELIEILEGKMVPAPNGDLNRVQDGKLWTRFGAWSLCRYSEPELEIMFRQASSPVD